MTSLADAPISNFYGSWIRMDSCDETELKSQLPIFQQLDYVYYIHECETNDYAYFKLEQDRDRHMTAAHCYSAAFGYSVDLKIRI